MTFRGIIKLDLMLIDYKINMYIWYNFFSRRYYYFYLYSDRYRRALKRVPTWAILYYIFAKIMFVGTLIYNYGKSFGLVNFWVLFSINLLVSIDN